MSLRLILRLLLAGLVAGSALLALALDPRSLFLVPSAHADDPGDWPMFHHDPAYSRMVRTSRMSWEVCYNTAKAV